MQYSDESGVQYSDDYCTVKKPFNDQMMSLFENVICYTQACHSRVFKILLPLTSVDLFTTGTILIQPFHSRVDMQRYIVGFQSDPVVVQSYFPK